MSIFEDYSSIESLHDDFFRFIRLAESSKYPGFTLAKKEKEILKSALLLIRGYEAFLYCQVIEEQTIDLN